MVETRSRITSLKTSNANTVLFYRVANGLSLQKHLSEKYFMREKIVGYENIINRTIYESYWYSFGNRIQSRVPFFENKYDSLELNLGLPIKPNTTALSFEPRVGCFFRKIFGRR